MSIDTALRDHLARILDWEDSHVGFETAVADIPEHLRGMHLSGLHSPWQLVEHLRRAQRDILEFCRNADYEELKWPEDYWPSTPAPPSTAAWEESLAQYRKDRRAMQALARDPAVDLAAKIPWGSGQTCLREILLTADHTAYHIGQLVLVRQLLGIWKPVK